MPEGEPPCMAAMAGAADSQPGGKVRALVVQGHGGGAAFGKGFQLGIQAAGSDGSVNAGVSHGDGGVIEHGDAAFEGDERGFQDHAVGDEPHVVADEGNGVSHSRAGASRRNTGDFHPDGGAGKVRSRGSGGRSSVGDGEHGTAVFVPGRQAENVVLKIAHIRCASLKVFQNEHVAVVTSIAVAPGLEA